MGHDHSIKKVPTSGGAKKLSMLMIGPFLGIIIGGVIGSFIKPDPKLLTSFRSLAAGIVIAAVSTELIPEVAEVEGWKNRLGVLLGIVIGAGALIGIRSILNKYEKAGKSKSIQWEMVTSIAIDFFIDAVLIGMAMTVLSGEASNAGLVIAISLGIEMLLVTFSLADTMNSGGVSRLKIMGICAGLLAIVTVGAIVGYITASKFKGTSPYYAMLAFGVAALLWLVVEELLVEKVKGRIDSRLQATFIFVGFILVIGSGWLGHHH